MEILSQVSEAEGRSVKHLKNAVLAILKTMGHSQDISSIRKFAFVLPKLMKTLCDKVLVHKPGVDRVCLFTVVEEVVFPCPRFPLWDTQLVHGIPIVCTKWSLDFFLTAGYPKQPSAVF